MTSNIENLTLELLRLRFSADVDISVADLPFLTSMNNQIVRGLSMTDRQYQLLKTKITNYRDCFTELSDEDFEQATNTVSKPFRVVDRRRVIVFKTVHKKEHVSIQTPFSKKTLHAISMLSSRFRKEYYHPMQSKEHYFVKTPNTVEAVVETFRDRNFEIDPSVDEYYKQVKLVRLSPMDHVPRVEDGELKNVTTSCKQAVANDIGAIVGRNLLILQDKKSRYGLSNLKVAQASGLIGDIMSRETPVVHVHPDRYNLDNIADSLHSLDRYPLLVLIDDFRQLYQLKTLHCTFSKYVENKDQTVLFRVENDKEYTINQYIKENQLNNWLDQNTKIVYICKNKLPKLVLKTKWSPSACVALSSTRSQQYVTDYVMDRCDLIVFHDSHHGHFYRKNY